MSLNLKVRKKLQEKGRPKGSVQKRKFLDTHVGRFIYLSEPLLYYIICPTGRLNFEPEVGIIESVISASDNPSFKTARFKKYLDEYRQNGLHVKRKKKITPEIVDHYTQLRMRRAINYIKDNRDQINKDKSQAIRSVQDFIDQIEK